MSILPLTFRILMVVMYIYFRIVRVSLFEYYNSQWTKNFPLGNIQTIERRGEVVNLKFCNFPHKDS